MLSAPAATPERCARFSRKPNHPLLKRMHRPDPNYGPDEQDKRSVVSIEHADVEQWLYGTREQASVLVRPPAMEVLDGQPG